MATGVYSGVSDVARKVKKLYFGSAGIAKQVKKGYIGVNGLARLFYSGRAAEAGPYRFDFTYTTNFECDGVLGPMDETTFARYGDDIHLANPIGAPYGPGLTRQYACQACAKSVSRYQDIGTFDLSNGARINYISNSPYTSKMRVAGTQDYIVVDSWNSNSSTRGNRVFDPLSLSLLRSFNVYYNAEWKGGYNNNAICYDAHQDDSADGAEYNLETAARIRTIMYLGKRETAFYIQHVDVIDGMDGKLFMGTGGKNTGIADYSTLSLILEIGSAMPSYSSYARKAVGCVKP